MKNDSARDERLKAALRDNLRRRKAQTRGRDAPPAKDGETGTPREPTRPTDDPLSDKTDV